MGECGISLTEDIMPLLAKIAVALVFFVPLGYSVHPALGYLPLVWVAWVVLRRVRGVGPLL